MQILEKKFLLNNSPKQTSLLNLKVVGSYCDSRYELGVSNMQKILDSLLWLLIIGGVVGFIALIAVGGLTYFNFS